MASKRREILDLLRLLKQKAPDRLLNEAVRRVKLKEADVVNHGGLRRQLDFLIEHHGLERVKEMAAELLAEHREVREMARALESRRKLADLVRSLYHYKACEADTLAMGDVTAQVKFLCQAVGGRDRLLNILGET